MRNDDCTTCGGFGFTVDVNDDGEEFATGCHECFVAAHEADATPHIIRYHNGSEWVKLSDRKRFWEPTVFPSRAEAWDFIRSECEPFWPSWFQYEVEGVA